MDGKAQQIRLCQAGVTVYVFVSLSAPKNMQIKKGRRVFLAENRRDSGSPQLCGRRGAAGMFIDAREFLIFFPLSLAK